MHAESLSDAIELSGRDTTISLLFTPKYHCELVGEGIEYCWGAAKRMYQKLPRLNENKSWESFRKSVAVCLSQVNIEMLHAWLLSPSLGSGRRKRRSKEF
jgi:hypothetical protein